MAGNHTLAGATTVDDRANHAEADLAEDTRALLQRQLRAVVGLFLILVSIGFLARLAPLVFGQPPLTSIPRLIAFPLVGSGLLMILLYVSSNRRPSLAGLRLTELYLFGVLTALIAINHTNEVADP